jgi:uncharacterized iron-regulated protein
MRHLVSITFGCVLPLLADSAMAATARDVCPTPGAWVAVSDSGRSVRGSDAVTAELAQRRVVLLGESHDNAEHHRWQLHTIAALHARQPRLALGFEMFPRRVQPVLDQWSAGELTEEQFLARSDWASVWGHDPQLYMPIFHFARMHRIPMIALNVERSLVRRVGSEGWDAVPPAEREGVGEPASAPAPYLSFLYESYLIHLPEAQRPRRAPTEEDLRSPQFRRFVESMQVWDRAMAQAIVERLSAGQTPLVVAIMGAGHLRDGHGVPHQLRGLGIADPAVLLPWDVSEDCALLTAGVADLAFGVEHGRAEEVRRPRLGVTLDQGEQGVTIRDVMKGSIAESAGARAGDVIKTVAGMPVKNAGTVTAAVQRQAPGTWLPITVQRGAQSLELVARFPGKP